jgi:hypothetical protein
MLTQSYPLVVMALPNSVSSPIPVTAVASPELASDVWKGEVSIEVL